MSSPPPATLDYVISKPLPPSPTRAAAAATVRFPFAFALCQIGAEAAAKAELVRLRPSYRPAFMRPGLLTWKCEPALALDDQADELATAVFFRAFGASLGRAGSASEVAERVQSLVASGLALPPGLGLQVYARRGRHDDDSPRDGEADADPRIAEVTAAIVEALPALRLRPGPAQQPGELLLDVVLPPRPLPADIVASESVGDEPWLLGLHRHCVGRSPHPGGRLPLRLPSDAPSRAWLKLEEGLAFSGLGLRPGQVAVEIGAAPGGASWALLQRGLTVVGVDPGAMDPRVLQQPRFTHLQTTLAELRREALPARVDWLLLDVNLAPQVALHGLRRLVGTLRSTLRGALLTLKLNDWSLAGQVPRWLEQLSAMGFDEVRATQLSSNRQEICVAAQRRIR